MQSFSEVDQRSRVLLPFDPKIYGCLSFPNFYLCMKQNRSTEGCSKLKRSVDMTSSGKNDLNNRTNTNPKFDRTRCPEE